jgi:hypothetical protein
VLREWGRIGVTGFGGPPAHIALLRRLCVDREGWLDAAEFEDAIAACNLLPGWGRQPDAPRRKSRRIGAERRATIRSAGRESAP